MPTPVRRAIPAAPVVGLTVVLLATGCGRSVAVDPLPILSEASRAACAEVIAALPQEISAGRAWTVAPDPGSTSAWGSPAVVLQCGDEVPEPDPTDQLLDVDGTTWLVTTLTQGEQYSSVDRTPGIVVTVPQQYSPSAGVLVELLPAVVAGTEAG
jgi:hypothetical protein